VLPPGESESFQLIRAHLRHFNVDRELRTLLIASAAPGDGKTTIARHLAGAAARAGSRVLLLEADLRRPALAQQLDAQSGPGLADVLIGAVPLSEATVWWSWVVWDATAAMSRSVCTRRSAARALRCWV